MMNLFSFVLVRAYPRTLPERLMPSFLRRRRFLLLAGRGIGQDGCEYPKHGP